MWVWFLLDLIGSDQTKNQPSSNSDSNFVGSWLVHGTTRSPAHFKQARKPTKKKKEYIKCVHVGSITKLIDKISVFHSNNIFQDVLLSDIYFKKTKIREKPEKSATFFLLTHFCLTPSDLCHEPPEGSRPLGWKPLLLDSPYLISSQGWLEVKSQTFHIWLFIYCLFMMKFSTSFFLLQVFGF